MRFRQHKFETKISNLITPQVLVTPQALQDMWDITDLHNEEVGWLGTAERTDGGAFLIGEIFLLEQRAHSTTTEIDTEGLEKLYQELLTREDGIEVVNKLRFWGHSHVNMGLGPSGQDTTTLRQLAENSEDFFIAARTLKRGEVRFDLLRADGLMIDDIPWQVYAPAESRRARWEQELKDKVKGFTTTYFGSAGRRAPSAAGFGFEDSYYDGRGYGGTPLAGGASGRAGSGAASAPNGKLDKTPLSIDVALGTYIDHWGRKFSLASITDEELMLYGYELVSKIFYAELPDRFKIDAIWDKQYRQHWVIGLDELEDDDDQGDEVAGPSAEELDEIELMEEAEARERAKHEEGRGKKKEKVGN